MRLDDDDFTLFGLPRRFALDRAELDARWRALQSEVHPDRFVHEGAASQRLAMQWAVRVNQAYQRLKEPLARAAYLCELAGAHVDAHANTAMPADFLARQMAWREALEEAADAAAVEQLDREVSDHEREQFDALAQALDVRGDAQSAAGLVRQVMFLDRFRADIRRRLEALDA